MRNKQTNNFRAAEISSIISWTEFKLIKEQIWKRNLDLDCLPFTQIQREQRELAQLAMQPAKYHHEILGHSVETSAN